MADTQTTNLLLVNQEAGGNNNTWGDIADSNFERLDNILGDTTSITTTGGNTTLTSTQELVAIIEVDGALVSNANVIFSGRGGTWVVKNATTGSYPLTCKVSGQTGVEIDSGDTKIVYCDGTDISLANPAAPVDSEITVASATTCDILGAASEYIAISGTTAITSFGTGASKKRFVRATGAFTLTHNATSLILPGAKNITAAAGDTFIVISDSSSNARVYAYQKATGQAVVSSKEIGEVSDYLGTTAPANHLFLNGQTIGNASSNATARASSSTDTQTLFALLWGSFSNTELPIQDSAGTPTSRGASASADFSANKRLPLPDARGRVTVGLETMGGTTSSDRLTGLTGGIDGDTMGATGGAESHTLTTAQTPSHLHSITDKAHSHATNVSAYVGVTRSTTAQGGGGGNTMPYADGYITGTDSKYTGITATENTGGDGAHNNVQPTLVLTKIVYAGAA